LPSRGNGDNQGAGRRSWLARLRDLPNDSPAKTVLVVLVVSLVCSIVVAGTAVVLRPLQVANKERERQLRGIWAIVESLPDYASGRKTAVFEDLEVRLVDLNSGAYDPSTDPRGYDQAAAARDPDLSVEIPPDLDLAGIKRRAKRAAIYLLGEEDDLELVVLPVHGKGYASTLYGYLALTGDTRTVAGLRFYEHAETPGLGALIESPAWRDLWPGKSVWDPAGAPRLGVADGPVDPGSPEAGYLVDGLTGATRTSRGVDGLLRYWLGDHGFGPYLRKLREQRG
jgi:Na+-transporting NADH:ubiquinone oxidoreductase subunit C